MGIGYLVKCPDCGREWDGSEKWFLFGPWSRLEYPVIDDGFRSWFCSRCNFRVYIPRTIERTIWRRWYAVFLDAPASESPLLRGIAVKLDEALSGGRYYTPLPVALEPVDCPGCQGPFEVDGVGTLDQLVCPDCGRREAIVVGSESDWQMSGDLHESS